MVVFSRDFTTNLARQCRALKIEKLKAPLFRGPEGAGAISDWCITALLRLCFRISKTRFSHDAAHTVCGMVQRRMVLVANCFVF